MNKKDIVRMQAYFIEQHKHDDTTKVACSITKTTTIVMKMMMMRLAAVDHHARGRELRSVSISPEGDYDDEATCGCLPSRQRSRV